MSKLPTFLDSSIDFVFPIFVRVMRGPVRSKL